MRIFSIVFSIFVVVIGVVFAVKNSVGVNVDFVVYQGSAPLSLALILAFALGALFGVIVCFIVILKLKRTIYKMEKTHQLELKENALTKSKFNTHQEAD